MIKKIVLILILIFYSSDFVSAANDYYYNYVCDNSTCHNTKNDIVSDKYYIFPAEKIKVDNFSDYIIQKLLSYSDYYWNTKFDLIWYCEWDCNDLYNKKLSLSELLAIKSEFKIWKKGFWWFSDNEIIATYDSWTDYLLTNFTGVINSLHDWFPNWDLKPYLSDILNNILSYSNNTNNFNIKNVCDKFLCTKSSKKNINFSDDKTYYFVSWLIKQSTFFKEDTFKVSNDYNISSINIKAWEYVNFNFWFEDYLNQFWNLTEYEYKIYYNYEWDWIPTNDDLFLTEKFKINWSDFSIISDNKNADSLYKLDIIDEHDKKIRLWIKEWIRLSKAWKVNFYLSVENKTSNDKFDIKLVNKIPLNVLPNDDVKSSQSVITSAFSKELNTSWFNQDSPFEVELSLYDWFWNIHFDEIIGYDILLSDGSSSDIQLAVWDWLFSDKITWLKTNNNKVKFKFRVREPWYHVLNWFDITVKTKSDINNYNIPYTYNTIKNVVPSNLFDWDQKMSIRIKQPVQSNLVGIKCWKSVTVNFVCTSDNFSWCNIIKNTKSVYDKESDNGKKWSLTIQDNAFNTKEYLYTINHVDTTAPIITLTKWLNTLLSSDYTYLANDDDLKIDFYERTTENCSPEVNYDIKLNWKALYNWILNWVNTSFTVKDLFKKIWTYTFNIKATDKYWNSNEKEIKFVINPDKINVLTSTVSLVNILDKNKKFWNNHDIYKYKLSLKDKFLNPIYNKKLLFLNTDCKNIPWDCNWLYTDLGKWKDAWLEIYDINIPTDDNWEYVFDLKSLVPWKFTEVFKIKLYDWNINYTDNVNVINTYDIWFSSYVNEFLKPVTWTMSIVEWWTIPEIWKNQKYNISLTEKSGNLLFSGASIDIKESTIVHKTNWHFWNNFVLINNNFTDKINTPLFFSWSIDANENILSSTSISTKDLIISYKIWWELVKYYLDNFWISWCNVSTLWLKIIWNIQWDWKSSITWQKSNFSDLTKLDLRTKIRSNWFKLIKSMNKWQILNWIKYVEWDIDISSDLQLSKYETLVVYNWNVIISGDLNTLWKKLWIIVLKDKYLVTSDFNEKWNVYVNKDVEKINAVIYADWWFFSAYSNWEKYNDLELNKILTLNWTLFTRNTVWWAVKANLSYLLPWWQATTNYFLAERYDLNYIRKVANQCNWNDNYSFLIKYDSKIQLNPPKWFEN